jgi:hypothetical protein
MRERERESKKLLFFALILERSFPLNSVFCSAVLCLSSVQLSTTWRDCIPLGEIVWRNCTFIVEILWYRYCNGSFAQEAVLTDSFGSKIVAECTCCSGQLAMERDREIAHDPQLRKSPRAKRNPNTVERQHLYRMEERSPERTYYFGWSGLQPRASQRRIHYWNHVLRREEALWCF